MEPRQFKYDMPKFGEPGMLMAEIPTYSKMADGLPKNSGKPKRPPHKMSALSYDLEMLEFYSGTIVPAVGVTVEF